MACNPVPVALASLRLSLLPRLALNRIQFPKLSGLSQRRFFSAAPISRVGWDDVARVIEDALEDEDDDNSDLKGYFDRVRDCNRGSELQLDFVPFVIEDQIVGYVHKGFIDHLRNFQDIFTFELGNDGCYAGGQITLHSSLKTLEDRTRAVGDVIKCLGELIPGIRSELYPVTSSFGMPIFFSLERAAAPYLGIKAYGVHMNGYVDKDGEKYLWIGKRSDRKPTYPGMLDHLVAGGLGKEVHQSEGEFLSIPYIYRGRGQRVPHGITCKENIMKECEEEAGIPRSIANTAISVGAISYIDIDGYRYKRDTLFCYDLKLPAEFVPMNEDGEVDSFRLIPVTHVANIIRRTEFFKPNCSLVIIDFLFRHGYISPDDFGYLKLLQSLRSGGCS